MLKKFIEFQIQLKWYPNPYLDDNKLQILNMLVSTQLSQKILHLHKLFFAAFFP